MIINKSKFIEVVCPICKKKFLKCRKTNRTKALPPGVLRCNAVYCSKECSRNIRDNASRIAAKKRYYRNKVLKQQQCLKRTEDIKKT